MYTYEKELLFSDIDYSSRMSIASMIDAMQDVINLNSESIGKGIDYILEHKRAWFTVAWNIEIKRYPKIFEKLTVKTWPYLYAGAFGNRNVVITDENGEDVVFADSIWSMVDVTTGMPTKITQDDIEGYELEERYPMDNLGRKIKIPKEEEFFTNVGRIKVNKSDLDYNRHMTNAKYIKYAFDYIPVDVEIKRIRVEYKAQCPFEEEIDMMRSFEEEEGRYIIKLVDSETRELKAVVEFLV